jgi:hypothetical protein
MEFLHRASIGPRPAAGTPTGADAAIPLSTSFNQCLSTGDPTFCALVERSSSGALFGTTIAGKGFISGTAVNEIRDREARAVEMMHALDNGRDNRCNNQPCVNP